jgi:hypothetical protein
MTENGMHYIAEQAWTCCTPDVASRLLEVDSPTWLLPFLRLAGGDGEQAGARLLSSPPPGQIWRPGSPRTRLEEVELGDAPGSELEGARHVAGARRSIVWRTAGFTVLFRRLDGELSARPRRHGTVLALEGGFESPAGLDAVPNGALASRRAAEAAARSLLGHLRSALEDPAMEEMLA